MVRFAGPLQFVAVQNELRHPRARKPLVHGLLFNGTMRLGLAQVSAFDQQALGPVYQANFGSSLRCSFSFSRLSVCRRLCVAAASWTDCCNTCGMTGLPTTSTPASVAGP